MTGVPFTCRCVLCHDYGDRDAADRAELTVIGDVRRHGWHVVMVPEDEVGPGFAYTIGLAHAHGAPELAMFGLGLDAMHRVLNALGDRAASGSVLSAGQVHQDVADGYPVALREVDLRWYRVFFGRAIGFYRRPPFPVLQVAWPDAAGLSHWDRQATGRHRESQPQLWLRPDQHPVGVWTSEL
ncbi:DUF4262 domain-containing protein [Streptomyces sp. MNP-20]|uniref:DUF4262 domain-containing protein n=1 Tax=Streptomyces sp. MNP-20 TaxID=2721165 RepID=UPI0015526431|nr:DUF4262 domain-containing protein [Streptomyces sp. MNP-20]